MPFSASVWTPATSTSFSRASIPFRCSATCGRSSMSSTRFTFASLTTGLSQRRGSRDGDGGHHRDEGAADAEGHPVPVRIGIHRDEVGLRSEEEVPLREEDLVEREEQRIESHPPAHPHPPST